jgi:hypothetical protein
MNKKQNHHESSREQAIQVTWLFESQKSTLWMWPSLVSNKQ